MKDADFGFVFLGQSILRYRAPKDVVNEINSTYEKFITKKKFPHMGTRLIGKIQNEHSLFWNSIDETKYKRHSFLSENVLNFFREKIIHYLEWNKIKQYRYKINSIWVNEMKAGEYNPVHVHSGDRYTGLSSVMFLRLPKSYGKEWSRKDRPTNGQLELLANATGYFAKTDYAPQNLQEGDFILFPYDIKHLVYPFRGKGKRRTLSMNVDITYNPFESARA
tara:strand:- start:40 stop:702 length:663 start_codon:yes stop_codon:yes gene_type:complete